MNRAFSAGCLALREYLGRCPRLLWVVSRGRRVFYWFCLIHLFPRASAAASGGVWGSAPSAQFVNRISAKGRFVNLVVSVLRTSPLLWLQQSDGFSPTAHPAIRGRPEPHFRRTLSRNLTIRVSRTGTSSSI